MENRKIKKINVLYLLCYILVPLALIFLCGWFGTSRFPDGSNLRSFLLTGPFILSMLWWVFGGRLLFRARTKAVERELDSRGFQREYTFSSGSCTVIIDTEHQQIALLFFWKPFTYFVIPASSISRAWVDDGRMGSGFMAGSSRVSFLFLADGVKVRINTFVSNKRWRMDSDHILTGISKADRMVRVLQDAGVAAN